MTVKSLSEDDKNSIVQMYQTKKFSMAEIAEFWFTSTRTIGRVLEERGLATPVPRLKGEAHQVMLVLKEWDIEDAAGLRILLEGLTSLAAPSEQQVQAYLDTCTKTTLIYHFHKAGLHKLTDLNHAQQPQAVNDLCIPA